LLVLQFPVNALADVEVCIDLFSSPLVSSWNNVGWLTKFSNISFINVALRGMFRWKYDGLYQDDDGTLTGQNQSMILMAPDSLTNASSSCTPAPYFENAVQCPLSQGSWVRFYITVNPNYYWYSVYVGTLLVTNEDNNTASALWPQQSVTFSSGYLMTLQVNRTYQVSAANVQVNHDLFLY
jgi:hypothetical protein